jgi:hypothetical protein
MSAKVCSCGAVFEWIEHHRTHKLAPIEVQPSEAGNILVFGPVYLVVPPKDRAEYLKRGDQLRVNHFARCPYATRFREGGGP